VYKWLTPDEAPTGSVCILLIIPEGEQFAELVRGALAPLLSADNFEPFGTLTPEETAAYFEEFMRETWDWQSCP